MQNAKYILLLLIAFLFITNGKSQIFPNTDFELGPFPDGSCQCPTDYTCNNDAGRVVDGINPVYVLGDEGCFFNDTNHTNSLGAHSGESYLFFWGGLDRITTPTANFNGGELTEICVWYAGPQGSGTLQQNFAFTCFFSLRMDGFQISPTIPVPVGTPWTEYCFTINATPGNHNFSIQSGGAGPYAIWLDDFTVDTCRTINLGRDTSLCEGDSLIISAKTIDATYLWQDGSTEPTFTVQQEGTYIVDVTSSCGNVRDSITVSYDTPPIVNLGNDTTLCDGDSLFLNVGSINTSYLWQNNSTDSVFTVIQQGTYWVEVTSNNCGIISDTVNVLYDFPPLVNLGNDTALCDGDSLTLIATNTNASYLWQDNSTDSIFNVTQQGTYWVEVTLSNNVCNIIYDTITVVYNPLLAFTLGGNTTLCEGDSLFLDVTNIGASYLWQDNSTNSTFNIAEEGIYWVRITNNCRTVSDTIVVTFDSPPIVNLGNDTTLCTGDALILNASNLNGSYLWQDNSTDSIFNVTQQGTYWVEVNLSNNVCNSLRDTIEITYELFPSANLGNDTTLCIDDVLSLNASNLNGSYLWQDNSRDSVFNVTEEGIYWLNVTNYCGTNSDTINITMEDCNCYIYIANTFTPDKDGINDFFSPTSNCNFLTYSLEVFDRFGQRLFETNNISSSWNGTFKENIVPSGSYVYKLSYTFKLDEDSQKESKIIYGHINLIR